MKQPISAPDKEARAFTVLDLENQCGGAELVPQYAEAVRQRFEDLGFEVPCQTVLAVGTRAMTLCPDLPFIFPHARLLCRGGLDGADKCLCEVLSAESTAARSRFVVIGSGDRLFAEPARKLREQGCTIIVVAPRGSIHHELYGVAHDVIHLDAVASQQQNTELMGPA
jgi:hypothetical protein